jgi:alpha-glucosidase (family GH31 glycosyl hydrolase)
MRGAAWILVAISTLGPLPGFKTANAATADFDSIRVLATVDSTVHQESRLINPDVLEIQLTAIDPRAKSISVQFLHDALAKQRYYGVWETIHGMSDSLDNRGSRDEFAGTLIGVNVNFSSVRAPFYMTSLSHGKEGTIHYGIYVKSTSPGRFYFAQKGFTGFSFDQAVLTYDIIYGPSYAEVLSRYNQLAGPSVMPPLWAFDSGWWRDDAHTGFHNSPFGKVTNAQENVLDDADQLERLQIPAAWLWVDRPYGTGANGWGNFDFDSSFPNPLAMIYTLAEKGYNLLVWAANKTWNPSELWSEGVQHGYLYADTSGSAADLKKTGAYPWLRNKLDQFAQMGIKGFKLDRGEEEEDAIPNSDKNSEVIEFSRLASEVMVDRYGSDHYNFARNLNDTARRYSAAWGGDPQCSFGGLQQSITQGLRSAMINFPMWGSDTGGILCSHSPKEVFSRWFEFSALSPMMEVAIGSQRTPWYDYDDQMIEIARHYAELHHQLMPYTRSEMHYATQTGMPVMRPLVLAYPDDPAVADLSDEYLYGSELLVAPVITKGTSFRYVYFPEGRWLSFPDGQRVQIGGQIAKISAPIDSLPLFVREGAIVPMGDLFRGNNHWTASWSSRLRLELYPSVHVTNHFDYFDGSAVKTIQMKSAGRLAHDVEVDFNDLGTPGEVRLHCHQFSSIEKNGEKLAPGSGYHWDAAAGVASISFSGRTQLLIHDVSGL